MQIKSYKGTYEVVFTDNAAKKLRSVMTGGDFFIIDQNVYELYKEQLDFIVEKNKCHFVIPNENAKSYHAAGDVIDLLINNGFKKNHLLIAIGGGITQDITAFIASILYRGVDWIFIPTNLLSQCDSCIGSKTSINFKSYKNQIGGFHPPKLII